MGSSRTRCSILCLVALLPYSVILPVPQSAQQAQPVVAATQAAGAASFRLEDGTPVRLRLQRTLSSADAQVDERVDFDVLDRLR